MTITNMEKIAKENGGIIPEEIVTTMTNFEIKKALKYGFIKEEPKKPATVQSPEPKKETAKESKGTPKKGTSKEAPAEMMEAKTKDDISADMNPPAVVFNDEQKKAYRTLNGLIYDSMQSMRKSSFDIAFAVHSIYTQGFYKIDGYKNIYEYGRECYGLARGTINNFINMVDRFCICDEENGKPVYQLKEDFSKYNPTQLICMLGHTTEELKEKDIRPEMSSRDIKKALKDGGANDAKGEPLNILNGDNASLKKSESGKDAEEEENASKKLRCNVILELDKNSLYLSDVPEAVEISQDCILDRLSEKVKVIYKLLYSGHRVQILDILP